MTVKKLKTYGIFAIFILCFLNHFMYNIFPNFITSILFPVNESIWEHMKMLVSSIVIWQIIEYIIIYKNKVEHNNFILPTFVMSFLSIIIFLVIYYPIYNVIGENFILNIVCLFLTIYFVSVIGYKIITSKKIKYQNIIGLIGIVTIYIMFTYLTYYPPKCPIFLDVSKNIYGINS